MTDIRNPVVLLVPAQWMPSINPSSDSSVLLNFLLWDGDPDSWSVSIAQNTTVSSALVVAIGEAITATVEGGATPTTVPPSVGGDPEVVVDEATVGGRLNVTLQFRDAGTHVDEGARVDLDVPSGYAGKVGAACAAL